MLKKSIAVFGLILFVVSLFPLNAGAMGSTTQNNTSTPKWTKHKKQSKTGKGKVASHGKPTKRKA